MACKVCNALTKKPSMREPYNDPSFDPEMGMKEQPDGSFVCPTCGTKWTRVVSEGDDMFTDYDTYCWRRKK